MIYKFVVSFILGTVFEFVFGGGWPIGLLVLILSLVLSAWFLRSGSQGRPFSQGQPLNCPGPKGLPFRASLTFFVIGLAFVLGVLRMNFADVSLDPNLANMTGQKISFEAVISEEPDVRDTSARYTVSPVDSRSLVLLIADRFPEFKYGDKIKVSGKLQLPENFESDNGTEFDYISYLSKDSIHFLIYRPEIDPTSSSSTGLRGTRKIVSSLYSLKRYFVEKIGNVVPEPNSSFLAGLIFGAKQSLGENLLNNFQKVGLIHIVVLSGQNLTIIASAILSLTSYFGRRKFGLLASALGIVIFSAMVGFTATVLRASIMAMIAIMARYLGRPSDALRALFIAGLLMIAWNPLTLFYDPSFQLSFMAALGLIIFSPMIDLFIIKKMRFIPARFGLREIVSSTFAVQIFILPLLIRMSGSFSLISFVANLIVLPIVPTVMLFGFLTGLVGMIPTQIGLFLSWPFGLVSYLVSELVIKLAEAFASIPFSTIGISTLPLWLISIWYLFYAFVYLKLKKKEVLYG